jgi:hypothetical protein
MNPLDDARSAFLTHRTSRLCAGAAALVATGLWVVIGLLNHWLLWNVGQRFPASWSGLANRLISLSTPSAMDYNLRPGEHQVSVKTAIACVVMALVVAGITYLAVRRLRPGQGRMTLFFAIWFAAVAGAVVASTIQGLDFPSEVTRSSLTYTLDQLLLHTNDGGHFGVALGWLVGLTAVITFTRSVRPAVPVSR